MSHSEQEIEVKFILRDLPGLAARVQALGGRVSAPRVHEVNLRFDTPDLSLTRQHRVLRLRQDANAVMTYKGPANLGQGVAARLEIEFQVSNFQAARHLLEALGYQVSIWYEKYRTTYELGEVLVTLDEMPFGSFAEIEGPDAPAIRTAAAALKLDWEARCTASYLALFDQLRASRGLKARNLSFEELQGTSTSPEDFGLRYADLSQ